MNEMKNREHRWSRLGRGLALSAVLATGVAAAQSTTGDVLGTITDPTGASVEGATVTLVSTQTQETRTTQTTASGAYFFNLLQPGTYTITINKASFKSAKIPDIALAAGDRAREDASLAVGAMSETVEVTATTPALQADSSVLNHTITEQAVQDLPLNGRNFVTLAQLVPGANEGPPNGLTSGARPDDRRQTSSIEVNGQSDIINDWMVDGMDNNERIIGTIGIRPSIESIREVNVQTNTYTAEVGRTAGGVINVITKSGSNQFHGSAFEYFRNDVLDAYPFQFGANNKKPKIRQNQFGGSLGGPIFHDKTFFFVDYEGLRQITGTNPNLSIVPDAATYAAIRTNPTSLTGGAAVDKAGLNYAMLYPMPNAPVTAGQAAGTGNFVSSPTNSRNSDTYDIRVDHQFSPNNLFYSRFSYNNVTSNFPGFLPTVSQAGTTVAPGGAIFNFFGAAGDKAYNGQLNFIHIFNPKLLVELKAGYTRINNTSTPLNYGTAVNTAFGQPNVNLDQNTSGLGAVGVSGYADLGGGAFIPIIDIDNTFQYMGTVTRTIGNHNIKMGAALIRRQALNRQDNYGVGYWNFNPTTVGATTISSVGRLLSGDFTNVQRNNNLTPPHYRTWEPSGFIQDDWKASPKLTLNIGIRYDVFTPFSEAHNAISNFDPATASIVQANVNGVNSHAGIDTTYTNVAPRFGFAFTPLNKTVIRGGFGMSYFPMNYTSNSSLKNQPNVSVFGVCQPGNCIGGYTKLAQGLPIPSAASAINPSGSIPDAVDPAFRSSYLEQTNLTVERDFGGTVVTATYVGMLGRHIAQIYNDQNAPAPVTNTTLNALARAAGSTGTAGGGTAFNTLRPFYKSLPNVTQIGGYNSRGASSYHALQLSAERRTQHGLTFGGNYTYSHALDNVIGLSNEINDGFGTIPSQMSTLDYGNSDNDLRHRGVVTANYLIPSGANLHGAAKAALKGWQANTIMVWRSGNPFTVTNSIDVINTNYQSGNADRPNQIRKANKGGFSTSQFFDIGAFTPQTSGTIGSERKNPLYGPHFRQVDFSLFKNFDIFRTATLQFRAEAFNIINTTNFNTPNHSLQVANTPLANGDPSNNYTTVANNLGTISSTSPNYNPRQLQFALKLQF
jgi:hypothetical protein